MAREDNGSGLVWFFLGVAVGATIAILYAPQSGKATREYIGRKTEEGKEFITDTARDTYEKGRELFERGREIAEEAAEIFERGRKLVHG